MEITMTKFQSTLPRREWRKSSSGKCKDRSHFNPHSHAGSDWVITSPKDLAPISIHTPTQGVTRFRTDNIRLVRHFNPHSHAGSDHELPHSCERSMWFQSTLPRREWRLCPSPLYCSQHISIHTPTQGVTIVSIWYRSGANKFQSTLPRREWQSGQCIVLTD